MQLTKKKRDERRKDAELLRNVYYQKDEYYLTELLRKNVAAQIHIKAFRFLAYMNRDNMTAVYFSEYKRQDKPDNLITNWKSIALWINNHVPPNACAVVSYGIGRGAVAFVRLAVIGNEELYKQIDRYLTVGRRGMSFAKTSTVLASYDAPKPVTLRKLFEQSFFASITCDVRELTIITPVMCRLLSSHDVTDVPVPNINASEWVIPSPLWADTLAFKDMNYADTVAFNQTHGRAYLNDETGYKSELECLVKRQLERLHVHHDYEPKVLEYTTTHTYKPDFKCGSVFIECKGMFNRQDRQKHLSLKKQYPHLDIRFIFERDFELGRDTTEKYSDWCKRYGYRYMFVSDMSDDTLLDFIQP